MNLHPFLRCAALMLFAAVAACAPSTHIESVKAPGYSLTTNRLLVIEQMGAGATIGGNDIQKSFSQRFAQLMNSCGVQTVQEILASPVGADETARQNLHNAIAAHISRYGVNTILIVSHVSSLMQTRNLVPTSTLSSSYELTLQDVNQTKLWSSSAKVHLGMMHDGNLPNFDHDGVGNKLAEDVVQQMQQDGVLTRCPAVLVPHG